MKKNKKAQVGSISNSILFLGIAAIVLVLFLVIIQELRDTDVISKAISDTANNETLTTVTEAGEDFANAGLPAVICTISFVTNETGAEVIVAGNYTQTNCNLASAAGSEYNNTNWNVSYGFTYGDTAYTTGNQTVVGLGTFADFWTIIVLAIVAAIVIGIIFGAFGGFSRRR